MLRTPKKTVWFEGVCYEPGCEVPDEVAEEFGDHVWQVAPESEDAEDDDEREVESEYDEKTVPQLQKECTKRGIHIHSSWNKAKLVDALEADDLKSENL